MGHICVPVFMIISIWNQWRGNKRFWWRKNLPWICEDRGMRFGLIKPYLPASHNHHRRPVSFSVNLCDLNASVVFFTMETQEGTRETQRFCHEKITTWKMLKADPGQSKWFRGVLCARFVCFVAKKTRKQRQVTTITKSTKSTIINYPVAVVRVDTNHAGSMLLVAWGNYILVRPGDKSHGL